MQTIQWEDSEVHSSISSQWILSICMERTVAQLQYRLTLLMLRTSCLMPNIWKDLLHIYRKPLTGFFLNGDNFSGQLLSSDVYWVAVRWWLNACVCIYTVDLEIFVLYNFRVLRKNIFVVQDIHENFFDGSTFTGSVIWNKTTHAKSTNSLHAAFVATMQLLANY